MDALDTIDAAIANGTALHVGMNCRASMYITDDRSLAEAYVAHINSFPGCANSVRIRTQQEINEYMAAYRASKRNI